MVVMINFHAPRLGGNFVQASEAYHHLINDILTSHKPNQSKTPAQAKAEKQLLDEEYLNDIASFSPDFAAYMFAVKFYADQCFDQLLESPINILSAEEKFHSLNAQFGMDLIFSHDDTKASVLKCTLNHYRKVIRLTENIKF